ncbi:MAG TPA: ATP-binding protein [Vicinamibacteria bacterium]|nr:ATP-binding protein [Vicinamibacteria bacterium]
MLASPDDRPATPEVAPPRGWLRPDAIGLGIAAMVLAGFTSYMVWRDFRYETASWRARVANVADSQARLLATWLQERRGDVSVLAAHPSVVAALGTRTNADPAASTALSAHLDHVRTAYGYRAALVLAPSLGVLAGSGPSARLDAVGVEETRQAMASRRLRVWLSGESFPRALLGLSMPVQADPAEGSLPIGCVVLVMEAGTLIPLLSGEAVPTDTGELVIAIRDPRDPALVRLAPLRHLTPDGPDLRRRASPELPGVLALQGQPALAEVRDYRGVPVFAASRPIPLTGWALAYKIDRSEALTEFRERTRLGSAMALLLVLGLLAALLAHRRYVESAALRQHLERLRLLGHLRLLLESTAEGIYGIDLDGRCTFINTAAARLIGYTPEQVLGRDMHALIHHLRSDGEPYPVEECPIYRAFRTPEGIRREDEVFWRADGQPFPVEYSSFPILEDGKLRGAVVTFSDISARRRLEEQLRHSQKMDALGRMAGGIAHDFNNLLTAIVGYGDLILADTHLDPHQRDRVGAIQAAASRAAELTRQLLAFSRKQVLVPRLFDLNAAVSAVRGILDRVIGADIQFRTELHPDLLTVRADPTQIEQVLVNLVVNARDAMPHGGEISVTTAALELTAETLPSDQAGAQPGRYAVLTVRDAGVGMPPEVRAHLFEPFFTTKEVGRGTGLGLATVYGTVNQSGGFVTVDSAPGKGSAFRVHLPLMGEAPAGETAAAVAAGATGGQETILLVEDEDLVRALAQEILVSLGYRVLEARHAGEALVIAERHRGPIHLLLTDVVMPHMGGPELAARLLPARPETRVLFVSGYTDDAILEHGISQEDAAFLAKPFTSELLARKVREVLG